ncbi:MAG: hypothetical protein ACKVOA_08285 [Methylophilaceae bacterium]
MKSLIEKIFRREPTLNYVIAEYKPLSNYVPKPSVAMAEYEVEKARMNDEMEIDNIYQSN